MKIKKDCFRNTSISMLRSFVTVILPITIALFTAFMFVFSQALSSVRTESEDLYEQQLLRITQFMNSTMHNMFTQSYNLKTNADLLKYTAEPSHSTTESIYQAHKIIQKLSSIESSYPLLSNLLLFIGNEDTVLSGDSRLDCQSYFSKSFPGHEKHYDEWHTIISATKQRFHWQVWDNHYLLIVDTLTNSKGNVVFIIDLDTYLYEYINTLPENSCIQIIDKYNNLLFSTNAGINEAQFVQHHSIKLGKETYTPFLMNSKTFSYRVALLVPENTTAFASKYLQKAIWLMLVFMLLYEGALVCYFIHYHYRPMKKLISIADKTEIGFDGKWNEYKILETTLSQSIETSRDYLSQLETTRRERFTDELVNYLIRGEQTLPDALKLFFDSIGILPYAMITITGEKQDEVVNLFSLLQETDTIKNAKWFHSVNIGEHVFYIIVMPQEQSYSMLLKDCRYLVSVLPITDNHLTIAVSAIKSSYSLLPTAYQELLMMLRIYQPPEHHAFYCYDTFRTDVLLHVQERYSPAMQKEFIKLLQQQQLSEAEKLLVLFIVQMLDIEPHTSFEVVKFLTYLLLCDGLKSLENTILNDDQHKMLQKVLLSQSRNALLSALSDAMTCFNRYSTKDMVQHIDSCNSIVSQTCKYIQENYKDEELSLTSIAQNVHLSPTYLSRLFKKETGYSVLEYVHLLRVNYAKSQLINTDKSIQTIAEESGFHSTKRLNELLKRYEGVTPTEYRNTITQVQRNTTNNNL